jgi:23S rRNA pseudouridine1911/1915/1917 synthase
VLYEDEHIAVINKPAGYMVHPVEGGDETTVVHGLVWRFPHLSWLAGDDRPGIVHRLDRDTSGIMLIAKHDSSHHTLTMKFKAREIHKRYAALCHMLEPVQGGLIDMPIGRSLRDRKKMAIQHETGRNAITEYRVVGNFGPYALVKAYPRSGRTHQIRVHLSFVGLPILCDRFYGREKSLSLSTLQGKHPRKNEKPLLARQALHAEALAFTHPETDMPMRFEASMPPDMLKALGVVRNCFPDG